jgi:hypothetical protein
MIWNSIGLVVLRLIFWQKTWVGSLHRITGQALLGVADAGISATAMRVYTAVNDVVDSPKQRLKQCLFTFEKVCADLSIAVMLCAFTLMSVRIGGSLK